MDDKDKKEILQAYKDYLFADIKRDIFRDIVNDMKKPKVIFQIFWPLGIIIIAWIVISILLFTH